MTPGPSVEQLDRLTATLDRARREADADTQQLAALIDEAAAMLHDIALNGHPSTTTLQDRTILAAAERTRRSHALLVQAIRAEMDKISRQIGGLAGNAQATVRYVGAAREERPHTFNRIG